MADWALNDVGRHQKAGMVTSLNTTPVGSGVAHTKGAWAQLIASTAFTASAILIELGPTPSASDYLTDLGIGAAASETVLVADMYQAAGYAIAAAAQLFLPIAIPAGTRLAARGQALSTSATSNRIGVRLFGAGFQSGTPMGRVTSWGANTTASQGTAVDAHATTPNTKGAWVEFVASTPETIRWLGMTISHSTGDPWGQAHQLDIGVGAGGSEEVVVPDLSIITGQSSRTTIPQATSFPVTIPAGSRIAVRQQSELAGASSTPGRTLYIVLHGVS